ncbi:MAG: tripartite tricarboxylate transporter substrate binding protein [Burkholderiales bacterium]|nr:tripartite tricarboxylate transporter substrate binding protein [Burkholderiales bacterium]
MMRTCRGLARSLAFALVALAGAAAAQSWPSKPVRWIVPFPPGGPGDTVARQIATPLAERLGQSVVIDNRPGANSNIGFEAGARAAPDGYTMLFAVAALVTNPHLYKVNYDPLRDLVPVAQMNRLQAMLVASTRFAPSTLQEVVAHARANPGKVKCAWGGSILLGLGCEVLKSEGKLDVTVVSYKGSAPALTDLLGGHVDLMIDVSNTAAPQIRAGKIKPIAMLNPARGQQPFPDLPALSEFIPGFEMVTWQGIVMPAGTPKEIVARLNREVNAVLQSPEVRQKFQETGVDPVTGTPEQFGEVMQRDYAKYGRIIRAANIKVD